MRYLRGQAEVTQRSHTGHLTSELTCRQEAMRRQHELRRDLHVAVALLLEGREVGLVFIGIHFLPVPVVGCRKRKRKSLVPSSLDLPDLLFPIKGFYLVVSGVCVCVSPRYTS